MLYWFYYSTQLGFWFPPDQYGQGENICIDGVPVKKDFLAGPALKYFYWTISKLIFWNLLTCKGTYIIDWVARAGWIELKKSSFFSFFKFEFESQNEGISNWRRRGVGARDGAPGGLRGVVRGEDNVLRAGADPGEIMLRNQTSVGEQREPGADWSACGRRASQWQEPGVEGNIYYRGCNNGIGGSHENLITS